MGFSLIEGTEAVASSRLKKRFTCPVNTLCSGVPGYRTTSSSMSSEIGGIERYRVPSASGFCLSAVMHRLVLKNDPVQETVPSIGDDTA